MMNATLQSWARALGGEVSGEQVLCPGPGHSPKDRSLSVKIGKVGEPIVHSFCGDDPIACKDYVRAKLGMAPFKPNGGRKTVATYEFCDPATGAMRYRKERVEGADGSKSFYFKPAGRNGAGPLLYGGERLADLADAQPVFVVEGEKKVDRLRELGAAAVSGDGGYSSKWLPSHAALLRDLHVVMWPDSDEPGEKYIAKAAMCLKDSATSIRVVRPFGPPNGAKGRDVCDWTGNAEALAALVAAAEVYDAREHESVNAETPRQDSHVGQKSPLISSAKELKHRVFEPIKHVVKGYVVEGVTILAGRPKIGKSWLALDWNGAISRSGFCFGDLHCIEGPILYLALEDNERRLKSRLYKLFGSTEWPENFEYATEWPTAKEGGIDAIRAWVKSRPSARMVTIDVLERFRTRSRSGKENAYAADYETIKELQSLASELNIAILVITHLRKGGDGDDPIEKISGTLGLSGGADAFLILDGNSNGQTLYGRGRDLEEFTKAIRFNRETCRWEILGEAADVRRSDERTRIIECLNEADAAMSPVQIAAETGLRRDNVRFLLGKMVTAGEASPSASGPSGRSAAKIV